MPPISILGKDQNRDVKISATMVICPIIDNSLFDMHRCINICNENNIITKVYLNIYGTRLHLPDELHNSVIAFQ